MTKVNVKQKVLDFLAKLGTTDEEGVHIHLGSEEKEEKDKYADAFEAISKRFDALEESHKGASEVLKTLSDAFTKMNKDAEEPGDPDKKAEAKDEEEKKEEKKAAEDSAKTLIAQMAILAPEHKVAMTTDSCGCKRDALKAAYKTSKDAIEVFTGPNPDFTKLTNETVDAVLLGATELVRQKNNARTARPALARDFGKAPPSPEDLNKRNSAFWATRH